VLAVSLSLSVTLETLVGAFIIRARYPQIRPRFADINWRTTRGIIGFSLYVLVLAVGAQLTFQTDAIVIGKFLTVASIPFFTTASILPVYLMQLVIGIAAVVMPTATRLHSRNDFDALGTMFLKWSKVSLSITLLAGLYLLVLGPEFLGWWLGREFIGPGGLVLRILMIGSLIFLPARGVALPILMGAGHPRLPAVGFAITGIANLALSVLLVRPYGIAGVAIATAVPNMLFAVYLVYSAGLHVRVGMRQYLAYVVRKPVLGSLPVLGVLYATRHALPLDNFIGLFAAGFAMASVFVATWVFYVYRDDPLVDLPQRPTLRLFQR
jgi:O-antigen/teichoic acid export membrane protein